MILCRCTESTTTPFNKALRCSKDHDLLLLLRRGGPNSIELAVKRYASISTLYKIFFNVLRSET